MDVDVDIEGTEGTYCTLVSLGLNYMSSCPFVKMPSSCKYPEDGHPTRT